MSIKSIESRALKLPLARRSKLAADLLESLDEADPNQIEDLWKKELERREKAILSGNARLIPAEEVMARVRRALKR